MRIAGVIVLLVGLAAFAAGRARPAGWRSGAPADSLRAEILESPATPWVALGGAVVGLIMIVAPRAKE